VRRCWSDCHRCAVTLFCEALRSPEFASVPVKTADALEPDSVQAPGLVIVTDPIVIAVVSVGSPVAIVAS